MRPVEVGERTLTPHCSQGDLSCTSVRPSPQVKCPYLKVSHKYRLLSLPRIFLPVKCVPLSTRSSCSENWSRTLARCFPWCPYQGKQMTQPPDQIRYRHKLMQQISPTKPTLYLACILLCHQQIQHQNEPMTCRARVGPANQLSYVSRSATTKFQYNQLEHALIRQGQQKGAGHIKHKQLNAGSNLQFPQST